MSIKGKGTDKGVRCVLKKANICELSSRRRKDETMPKPGSSINPGTSSKGTCLLLLRHPAYRQRELNTGVYVERENQSL